MESVKVHAVITIQVPEMASETTVDDIICSVLDKTEEHRAVSDTDVDRWEFRR